MCAVAVTSRLLGRTSDARLLSGDERKVSALLALRGSRLRVADSNLLLKINHALQKCEGASATPYSLTARNEGEKWTDGWRDGRADAGKTDK